jgi:hypothetical protein
MLTRRQQWRHLLRKFQGVTVATPAATKLKLTPPCSEPTSSDDISSLALSQSLSTDTAYSFSTHSSCGADAKRVVSFAKCVRVILVPTRAEEREANPDLFWTADNIHRFRQESSVDLSCLVALTGVSYDEARMLLYQPHSDSDEDLDMHFQTFSRGTMRNSMLLASEPV